MKTFRELDQVIEDWENMSLSKFNEKYGLEGFSTNTGYGFYRGICFAIGKEDPE